MTSRSLYFGYYPQQLDISVGDISISTLPNFAETVSKIESNTGVEDDWIYAPRQEMRPYSSRIFGLPKTHQISHSSPDSEDHLIFHLWVLSFFCSLRLTSTEAGFIDSTPIKLNKLFDFVLLGSEIEDVMSLAEKFWVGNRATPERSKLVAAVVHALLLSQNPHHLQFERFLLLYSTFDACFALAKLIHAPKERILHANRVSWMCRLYSMPIPVWADDTVASSEIALLRNASVHEALFMGEPLGFALHGIGSSTNLTCEMEALICRLLVALLGSERAEYVVSLVSPYQRHGLKIVLRT